MVSVGVLEWFHMVLHCFLIFLGLFLGLFGGSRVVL